MGLVNVKLRRDGYFGGNRRKSEKAMPRGGGGGAQGQELPTPCQDEPVVAPACHLSRKLGHLARVVV